MFNHVECWGWKKVTTYHQPLYLFCFFLTVESAKFSPPYRVFARKMGGGGLINESNRSARVFHGFFYITKEMLNRC